MYYAESSITIVVENGIALLRISITGSGKANTSVYHKFTSLGGQFAIFRESFQDKITGDYCLVRVIKYRPDDGDELLRLTLKALELQERINSYVG